MRSSLFFAVALLVAVSILLSCVNDERRENVADVTRAQLAGQFLHYASALNDLYTNGVPADGDVTAKVVLPDWLPQNSLIRIQISAGTGYAFTPSSPGLLSELQLETENSSHFGLSDAAGINTPTGRLARPGFIPAGYVVYVR